MWDVEYNDYMSIFELKVHVPNSNRPVHIYCHGFDCGSQNILLHAVCVWVWVRVKLVYRLLWAIQSHFPKFIPHFSGAAPPSVYCLHMYYSKSQKYAYLQRVNNFRKQQAVSSIKNWNSCPNVLGNMLIACEFSVSVWKLLIWRKQHGGRDCTKLWLYNSEANEPFSWRSLDNRHPNNGVMHIKI